MVKKTPKVITAINNNSHQQTQPRADVYIPVMSVNNHYSSSKNDNNEHEDEHQAE
jgi:hypothetical protein